MKLLNQNILRTTHTILAIALFMLSIQGMQARTWTSADGSKTFQGKLISFDPKNGTVTVELESGRKKTFNQYILSKADQAYLKNQGRGGSTDKVNATVDNSKPVQVFILLGQSNMLGFGKVDGDNPGTLQHATKKENLYPFLLKEDGSWAERKDVRNVFVMHARGNMRVNKNEWMTIKGGKIGPEIGIGHHVGNHLDAPVLILKSCIGNRSLGWDLLPPGSKRYDFGDRTYAGYKDIRENWPKGTDPVKKHSWYAGKQYDDDIGNAKKILNDLGKYYPGATKYEIAGFFWWQGAKDSGNDAHAKHYEKNLVHLIKQLRKDFDAPNAKFVCATLGQTKKGASGREGDIINAKLAVDGKSGKYKEFKGNVSTVYSNPLSQGGSANGHYDSNAKTYMNVGLAMGEAMVELLK